MTSVFQHPPEVTAFWRKLVTPLLKRHATPFYLFSTVPVDKALQELKARFGRYPIRHWLSFKTQPVRPLLQWWNKQGLGIEVVSEFEFLAARKEGFSPDRILVNGPAKHHWLPRQNVRGLRVNFDSVTEAIALTPVAKKLEWSVGLRLSTQEEYDPENPQFPTQFGIALAEGLPLIRRLIKAGLQMEMIHIHLRTNVSSAQIYERALTEVAEICRTASFTPKYVDCGGGFPPRHVLTRDGRAVDAHFSLSEMAAVYDRILPRFPGLKELWLENGRWLTARSGVLVTKVLDTKQRTNMRFLICDAGRTNHAMVSAWETHELLSLPDRHGDTYLTTVTGPTCMAFDQLTRRAMPTSIQAGDHLMWLDAGAYHLPWETRFSHGLAEVLWHDGKSVKTIRAAETFKDWWGQWQ